MKDKQSLHLKVQELADCFATNDPLKEMSILADDKDKDDAALKWLALSALHGINGNAKNISITQTPNGDVKVVAEYRRTELPSPGSEIGKRIIDDIRAITHLEGDEGNMPLALGIRDGSIEINVGLRKGDEGESVTLEFPE